LGARGGCAVGVFSRGPRGKTVGAAPRADRGSSSRRKCGRRRWGLAGEEIAQGMVALVDGLLRFGQAAVGAGVVVARRFPAQVGTERADGLQRAGAEPAGRRAKIIGQGLAAFVQLGTG
jgi:hypothetical protein